MTQNPHPVTGTKVWAVPANRTKQEVRQTGGPRKTHPEEPIEQAQTKGQELTQWA